MRTHSSGPTALEVEYPNDAIEELHTLLTIQQELNETNNLAEEIGTLGRLAENIQNAPSKQARDRLIGFAADRLTSESACVLRFGKTIAQYRATALASSTDNSPLAQTLSDLESRVIGSRVHKIIKQGEFDRADFFSITGDLTLLKDGESYTYHQILLGAYFAQPYYTIERHLDIKKPGLLAKRNFEEAQKRALMVKLAFSASTMWYEGDTVQVAAGIYEDMHTTDPYRCFSQEMLSCIPKTLKYMGYPVRNPNRPAVPMSFDTLAHPDINDNQQLSLVSLLADEITTRNLGSHFTKLPSRQGDSIASLSRQLEGRGLVNIRRSPRYSHMRDQILTREPFPFSTSGLDPWVANYLRVIGTKLYLEPVITEDGRVVPQVTPMTIPISLSDFVILSPILGGVIFPEHQAVIRNLIVERVAGSSIVVEKSDPDYDQKLFANMEIFCDICEFIRPDLPKYDTQTLKATKQKIYTPVGFSKRGYVLDVSETERTLHTTSQETTHTQQDRVDSVEQTAKENLTLQGIRIIPDDESPELYVELRFPFINIVVAFDENYDPTNLDHMPDPPKSWVVHTAYNAMAKVRNDVYDEMDFQASVSPVLEANLTNAALEGNLANAGTQNKKTDSYKQSNSSPSRLRVLPIGHNPITQIVSESRGSMDDAERASVYNRECRQTIGIDLEELNEIFLQVQQGELDRWIETYETNQRLFVILWDLISRIYLKPRDAISTIASNIAGNDPSPSERGYCYVTYVRELNPKGPPIRATLSGVYV